MILSWLAGCAPQETRDQIAQRTMQQRIPEAVNACTREIRAAGQTEANGAVPTCALHKLLDWAHQD